MAAFSGCLWKGRDLSINNWKAFDCKKNAEKSNNRKIWQIWQCNLVATSGGKQISGRVKVCGAKVTSYKIPMAGWGGGLSLNLVLKWHRWLCFSLSRMFDDKDLVNIALFGCLLLSLVPVKAHLGLADTATGSTYLKRHAFSRSTLLRSVDLHRVRRLWVCLLLTHFLWAAKSHVTSLWITDFLDTNLISDN